MISHTFIGIVNFRYKILTSSTKNMRDFSNFFSSIAVSLTFRLVLSQTSTRLPIANLEAEADISKVELAINNTIRKT
jgi:cytochrome bd-type quinol oxidase subunit 2